MLTAVCVCVCEQRTCAAIRWKALMEKREAAAVDRLPPTLRSIRLAAAEARQKEVQAQQAVTKPHPTSDASLLASKSTLHVYVLWRVDSCAGAAGESKGDEGEGGGGADTATDGSEVPRWGHCVVLDVPIYPEKPTRKTLAAAARSELTPGVQSYSLCPLALNVQAPRSLSHDFSTGPCRVPVTVVVRNNSRPGSDPLAFDLVLLDKPVGEAAATSKLSPVQWLGFGRRRVAALLPSQEFTATYTALVVRPGMCNLNSFGVRVSLPLDASVARSMPRPRRDSIVELAPAPGRNTTFPIPVGPVVIDTSSPRVPSAAGSAASERKLKPALQMFAFRSQYLTFVTGGGPGEPVPPTWYELPTHAGDDSPGRGGSTSTGGAAVPAVASPGPSLRSRRGSQTLFW